MPRLLPPIHTWTTNHRAGSLLGALAFLLALLVPGCMRTSSKPGAAVQRVDETSSGPVKIGLSINDPKAYPGYTLIAPVRSHKTFLIDMEGKVVRTWQADYTPGLAAYLLENGHLLRTGAVLGLPESTGPGAGGRVQEFDWYGDLVWDFEFTKDYHFPHHDITRLPNGNILLIANDKKTMREALGAGRRKDLMQTSFLYPDCLIEIKPTGKTTGEVVWEWHLWDHLVQESDPSKKHYGKVADHPELVDINYYENLIATVAATKDGMDKLRSLGYVGGSSSSSQAGRLSANWSHLNAVAYHPERDEIMVTSFSFGEFWIIDHSTTTKEAKGHTGGRRGKGGDLLYRWGNPSAYLPDVENKKRLFGAHDAHWIPPGVPGAGHVLVFNNGRDRPDGSYSSADELTLPVDAQGRYGTPAYGMDQPLWTYSAPRKADFYSFLLSGAQRLPNGNTLICSGCNGTLLEVTPEKEVVWKYVNPVQGAYKPSGRYPTGPEGFGPPGGGSMFRAYRYGKGYPGFKGKELTPGKSLEELLPKEPGEK